MPRPQRVPFSTYRLQLRGGMDFAAAAALVPYLHALGIDFLYLSPPLAARPGSEHGYDVVDPTRLDPELGGRKGFLALSDRLKQHGMGLLVDIVPNHMAAHPANPWWWDVLTRGQGSRYADMFDIDWAAAGGALHLPVLGDELERVLERGEIQIECDGPNHRLRYFELSLPLAPGSLYAILRAEPGDRALAELNAKRGPEAIAALGPLLEAQSYRLRFWRGTKPLNYRRFFTISELVGLRSERPNVFAAVHAALLELVSQHRIQGLRVDHPDGLRDPIGYVERLRMEATRAAGGSAPYLVLEKILTDDEPMREELMVDGTTGYETLRLLDQALVDPAGARQLLEIYARFTGCQRDFAQVVLEAKQQVLDTELEPELRALARRATQLLTVDDAPLGELELKRALRELVACFAVYRSYVRPGQVAWRGRDRQLLESAFAAAQANVPSLSAAFERLARLLFCAESGHDPAFGDKCRELLLKFQQLTGPAAAKGVEDTALYRWFPLASLCEVGGAADRFGIDVEQFHEDNAARLARWPHSMLATSTHDTKRSEDVRARIHALSELPQEWGRALSEWSGENAALKRELDGKPAPSANDEYLVYQTLLGIWPLDGELTGLAERLESYLTKALREAAVSSSWLDPNLDYERATLDFALGLLDPVRNPRFMASFDRLQQRLARAGMLSSLTRSVLKATCPGVPDYYQGTELWDLSLVDPDNRRPIDWELHARRLSELASSNDTRQLLEQWRDGRIKLWIIQRTLDLRRRKAELFSHGGYAPIQVKGSARERVIAFTRQHERDFVLVAISRFFAKADAGFGDTRLTLPATVPPGSYRDVLTGTALELAPGASLPAVDLFGTLPCAVLEHSS
jgi:(1->4)-alpha-D-glucan 1-alpha-D-glucosylmutase